MEAQDVRRESVSEGQSIGGGEARVQDGEVEVTLTTQDARGLAWVRLATRRWRLQQAA